LVFVLVSALLLGSLLCMGTARTVSRAERPMVAAE